MNNNEIQISEINPADIPVLQKLGIQTFSETFAWGNTGENMKSYLDTAFSETILAVEISNVHCKFFFAKLRNLPIGYLKINLGPAQNEFQDEKGLEIEKLYVLQEFQGRKIGQLLLEKALKICSDKNLDFVWLGVWEKNIKAIRFYEKNGFIPVGSHIFMVGDDEQNDILMKLELK